MLKKITLVAFFVVFGAVGYAGAASAHTSKVTTPRPVVPQGLCPLFMCY
jgi:hypothetical protein